MTRDPRRVYKGIVRLAHIGAAVDRRAKILERIPKKQLEIS